MVQSDELETGPQGGGQEIEKSPTLAENVSLHGDTSKRTRRVSSPIYVVLACTFFLLLRSLPNDATLSLTQNDPKVTIAASLSKTTSASTTPTTTFNESMFVPHIYLNDMHYRRVCANVHRSILCMVMRFPFPVPLQDPAYYDYPYPVDERYYSLNKRTGFLTSAQLDQCQQQQQQQIAMTTTTKSAYSMDERVRACLETTAAAAAALGGKNDTEDTVFAVWTRHTRQQRAVDDESLYDEGSFYDTRLSTRQGERMEQFFDKHVILVVGASPTTEITKCLFDLFGGGCKNGGIKPVSRLCKGYGSKNRLLGNSMTYPTLDRNQTFIGNYGWYPVDVNHGKTHRLPETLIESLRQHGFARQPSSGSSFQELRKVSFIVEYPIAHAQNQDMILHSWGEVETIQKGLPQMVMDLFSEPGQRQLAEMGYELGHVIAYDGLPQFNPTITGAFPWALKKSATLEAFYKNGGYPGWRPEYGTQCRGPLPPTSKLTVVNGMARRAFQDSGFDMNFYGRIWEFANLFWWQVKDWKGRGGLDCTHAFPGATGLACIHKYFLMVMVDDYYDNL
jgi:hypothetical protein